ncbi:MAG: anhydro-N-acetylmuramic acid kinase [Mariprofundaceae bacterium]
MLSSRETEGSWVVGMMAGTSVDAIDVAIVKIQKHIMPQLCHFQAFPMPNNLQESILRLMNPGIGEIDAMGQLDRAIGIAFATAALKAIKNANMEPRNIMAIGSHGQTIRHRPHLHHPFSLQIGCPSTIAERTGITTVADFRRRDIAAGGEGAPLVPYAHQLLFAEADQTIAIVNIGGIANVTLLSRSGDVYGFDTGPGNMIMDTLMLTLSDGRCRYDQDGNLAASGTISDPLFQQLITHPFLKRAPPKSTGREDFSGHIVDIIASYPNISDADRMATACEFTVHAIVESQHYFTETVNQWYLCGGGANNKHLVQRLSTRLAPANIKSTTARGIPPEAVEATSFALLAAATLVGEHNTLASVTGAAHSTVGGHIVPGKNWHQIMKELIYE